MHEGPAPTAFEAIGDLVDLHQNEGRYSQHFSKPSVYAARLRDGLPEDRRVSGKLTGCDVVGHSVDVVKRFSAVRPGTSEPISRFFRLHPDRPAPTIRAGTLSEHGSHTAPRPIHYSQPRCITVREAARLQSLPDWFQVDRTKWRGFMQVGNAVPPLLAQAVANQIKYAIEGAQR